MTKKYTKGFDVWALLLFAVIMIPNIIWGFIPAPNDILRNESLTPVIDTIASAAQIALVFALCAIRNLSAGKLRFSPLVITSVICTLLYLFCWVLYYLGFIGNAVIIGMAILPCAAFFTYALDRKNVIAIVPVSIFTVCHMIFALVNFVL